MILTKLKTFSETPVLYIFGNNDSLTLNEFLGKMVSFQWTGKIECVKCKKNCKKSFGEGFCFTCFQTAPEASPCILRPELCRAHLGEGRDISYEKTNHLQPHVVYLALTDVVKVGVTRKTQIPTRWIDQGAAEVIIVAETENRYQAGIIEVALKEFYTDKTNWRNMLLNIKDESVDLVAEKWQVHDSMPHDLSCFWLDDDTIFRFDYPVLSYPTSIQSFTFDDATTKIEGVLTGIRGQYLYLNGESVMNIRRHTGYEINFFA
jgi:hypothetical protein